MAELTGQTFAGFEVVAKLGEGGMGAVYKARQPLLDRFVALKVMSSQLSGDPSYVARFIREAASAAKLNHPNMVQVHTAGEQGGIYYIVMEFVEGESLNQRLKRTGALDTSEAIAITLHVATALQCAWNEAKLIHRDIKPDNIFLSKKGEVKVGDLGLAKSVSGGATEMTQSGMMMGSPHYISPEQARASKETDFRADIYSLGCTLYQLLTGKTPYQADEALAVVLKHVTDPVPDILSVMPNCPQALAALVGKMMAKAPDQRHASYEELMAELWRASDIISQQQSAATAVLTPAAAKAPTVVPTVKQPVVRDSKPVTCDSRFVMGGIVAVGVLLLAGLFLWSPWTKPSSQTSSAPSLHHSAALSLLGSVFTNSVGAEMVYIPPGEFMLGSTKEEQAWAVDNGASAQTVNREGKAPRKAAIKQGFWMGRTEVTVKQWKQFVQETDYQTDAEKKGESYVSVSMVPKKGVSWRNPDFGFEMQDNHPVCCISWNDSKAFCEWLTVRERKAGRLAADYVVRLPTEAEWEYACRGGRQTRFWWGESKDDSTGRLNCAGKDDGFEFLAPVDSYGARGRNPFGLADMLGNASELCLDDFHETQAHADLWTASPTVRVLRGGAFNGPHGKCRSAYRVGTPPANSSNGHGFRLVVGVELRSSAPKEAGILAPAETRVATLTTNPKVGEVYTLPLGSNVTMDLMGIPPGEFKLGSTQEEQAWALANGASEAYVKPEGTAPRKTTIKQGFWLGRTEVTAGQWKQFVNDAGYVSDAEKKGGADWVPINLAMGTKGKSWRDPGFGSVPQDRDAVCCVSWNDAKAFCEWLGGREQRAGRLPQGYEMRLPMEAEWEYACRAGTQTKFWWGESEEDGKNRLNWSGKDDGFEVVAPVDSYGARGRNGFGLADMLGNVYEWCLDEFDATQAHEDLWAGNPGVRVFRGAAFGTEPAGCRCAIRDGQGQSYFSRNYLGFRVCVGVDVAGGSGKASASPTSAQKDIGILAPPETRVAALTTTPKVGEVYTLPLGSNVTMELMGIPPGEFMLGSTKEEQEWAEANGCPQGYGKREGVQPRKATIRQAFWLGRTEVTVGQWKQFVAETGYQTDGEKRGEMDVFDSQKNLWFTTRGFDWRDPDFGFHPADNHPVCCISWNDAVAFCKWLNEREQKAKRLPPSLRIRPPTEAEWEYACRAGTQTKFWWGDRVEDGRNRLNCAGEADGFQFLSPVDHYGARGRNKFGLADMLGNVWEWCVDNPDSAGAHEEVYRDSSTRRVTRGCSFSFSPAGNRCATRTGVPATLSYRANGFRVCCGPALTISAADATTSQTTSQAPAPSQRDRR